MKLVEVELTTLLGARYVFPDMSISEMDLLLSSTNRGEQFQTLTIRNVSGAVLVLPWRIVDSIAYDGETKWKRPWSAA